MIISHGESGAQLAPFFHRRVPPAGRFTGHHPILGP